MQFTGTIDPRWGQWLNLAAFILSGLAMASWWQDYFSAKQVATIVGSMNLVVSSINYVLHGMPAPALSDAARKAAVLLLVLAGGLLLCAGDAQAQAGRGRPTGNPIADIHNAIEGQKQTAATKNAGIDDLVSRLDKLALPDFEFALAQAQATKNNVTIPCWQSWVDLIKARQAAAVGADGQPLPVPDPHIITAIERISELLAILRPDSTISLACVQVAATAGKDVATVVTGIISGGALGLFKLPIPIGPLP